MASSKIKNVNGQIIEDVSTYFSYLGIFSSASLKAVKVGQKLLFFSFFAYTSSGNYIPHAEEHLISSTIYNSSTLSTTCQIVGEADTGAISDENKATVIAKPDATGISIECDKANKRYIRLNGLFYIN